MTRGCVVSPTCEFKRVVLHSIVLFIDIITPSTPRLSFLWEKNTLSKKCSRLIYLLIICRWIDFSEINHIVSRDWTPERELATRQSDEREFRKTASVELRTRIWYPEWIGICDSVSVRPQVPKSQ